MASIEERVKKVIAEQLGVKPETVTDTARFDEDLGADFLDAVEVIMALEEEFEVEIPDDAAEKILMAGEAVEYFRKNGVPADA